MPFGGALTALLLGVSAICPLLTPAGLENLAKSKGGHVRLEFFASWCSSCRQHLTAHHDQPTLLIGCFDKPERLAAVVEALRPDAPCYTDEGIADALGVTSLPEARDYQVGASKVK